jgi:hypothetical protein
VRAIDEKTVVIHKALKFLGEPEVTREYEKGILVGASYIASTGEDRIAAELMNSIGIRFPWELIGRGLTPHQKRPLRLALLKQIERDYSRT